MRETFITHRFIPAVEAMVEKDDWDDEDDDWDDEDDDWDEEE